MMSLFLGLALGVVISVLARSTQFERDHSFYPTILIVIASYYVLFGLQYGDQRNALTEGIVFLVFLLGALAGHKVSTWIIAALLLAHGAYDLMLHHSESDSKLSRVISCSCDTACEELD